MTSDHTSATGPAPESKAKPRRKPANKQAADSKSTAGWNQWGKNAGEICARQEELIHSLLHSPDTAEQIRTAFDQFKEELTSITNTTLSTDDAVEMLAQHIVVKPVLDAIYPDYPFTERNALAGCMTRMLNLLDAVGLKLATDELQPFYNSVRCRMLEVKTDDDRHKVIIELFDQFFKIAFPKQQEKLGIVYTPIEVVDFMITSVNDILQREFGASFSSPNVQVLDPFTGTGTYMMRLLQGGYISDEALEDKYQNDLHAFEIVPLAYYMAALNIEHAYNQRYEKKHGHALPVEEYHGHSIVELTDTFEYKGNWWRD